MPRRGCMCIVVGLVNRDLRGNVGAFCRAHYIVGWLSKKYHSTDIPFSVLGIGMLVAARFGLLIAALKTATVHCRYTGANFGTGPTFLYHRRAMRICRFSHGQSAIRVGLISNESTIIDLTPAGFLTLADLLEDNKSLTRRTTLDTAILPRFSISEARLYAPLENQEVWGAGVTYQRSKQARMDESDFSASAYDRVYEAARPELFFKSLPHRVVAPGESSRHQI